MPKQTKLSPVWDFYTETEDPKYAQCKLCKEKKSLGSSNRRDRTLTNITECSRNIPRTFRYLEVGSLLCSDIPLLPTFGRSLHPVINVFLNIVSRAGIEKS